MDDPLYNWKCMFLYFFGINQILFYLFWYFFSTFLKNYKMVKVYRIFSYSRKLLIVFCDIIKRLSSDISADLNANWICFLKTNWSSFEYIQLLGSVHSFHFLSRMTLNLAFGYSTTFDGSIFLYFFEMFLLHAFENGEELQFAWWKVLLMMEADLHVGRVFQLMTMRLRWSSSQIYNFHERLKKYMCYRFFSKIPDKDNQWNYRIL